MATPRRTFLYHANAHVLSGQFTRPLQHLIDVKGATALPTTGGHGQALVENVGLDHFVSVKRGYTHASGSPQEVEIPQGKAKARAGDNGKSTETHYTTEVTAVAEGVNILDVVTADRVVARLASNATDDEPQFSLIGTKFENLKIAGIPVTVDVNTAVFEKIPTFKSAIDEHGSVKKVAVSPFGDADFELEKQPMHGAVLCSIVDTAKLKASIDVPGVSAQGHCLSIPKFGKLFLGELLLRHGRRTLTMIRFELGSPVEGSGTVVQADSNGTQWPPTHK